MPMPADRQLKAIGKQREMAQALKLVKQDDEAYLEDLKRKAVAAMDLLEDARKNSQAYQDYYDGIQWTSDERRILEARGQPALTFNHVKPAVNAIIGIVEKGKTDPKAWGRTPKDQDAAEVATDGLRFVADSTRLQSKRREALRDLLIWGICIAVVEVEDDEIVTKRVKPEEYFFDPYSREPDFSDARYDGIAKWMDEQDVIAIYPDKKDVITGSIDTGPSVNDTYKDRPERAWSFADRRTRRIMVFEMYHRRGADWYKCVFVGGGILEAGRSPYVDSRGRSKKCTIAQSAFVDRDNCRYGVVKDMMGPQDAINKGRSKAVHILNVAKLRVDPGTQDVDALRKEWAKPDGIIEARADQVEELGDKQLTPAHIELLRDAKDEMRRQSPTPGIVGRQGASQSGRAILAEQQAGLTEQAPLLASFDDWTLRIYRSIWDCIKQFWTAPKWVRVTDDENAPRFILMNAVDPQTGQPYVDPQTGQPMPPNQPAEMDVDIIIDSSPDTAAIQEEQFQRLTEMVQAGMPIPPDIIIEASSLPKKRLLLDKLKQAQEQAAQQPNAAMQAEVQKVEMQTQAKQRELDMQAQAKAQELMREDEADRRKNERAMALADKQFSYDMQRMDKQAAIEASKAQMMLEFKQRGHAVDLAHRSAVKQRELEDAASEVETQNAGDLADAVLDSASNSVQVMSSAAQAMADVADAIRQLVQMSAAPKRLIKDPVTGEKRVELVMDAISGTDSQETEPGDDISSVAQNLTRTAMLTRQALSSMAAPRRLVTDPVTGERRAEVIQGGQFG